MTIFLSIVAALAFIIMVYVNLILVDVTVGMMRRKEFTDDKMVAVVVHLVALTMLALSVWAFAIV
jgi:hypothetical protein